MADKKDISASGAQDGRDSGAEGARAGNGGESGQVFPVVTFTTFVLSIASSALVHLGEVPDPESGETRTDLAVAKHNVDILSMLKEKSAGNLDAEETRLIDGVLYELRLKYVIAAQ